MKKLLLLFIGITALSCSSDDGEAVECNCLANYGDADTILYTVEVELDCETGKPKYNPTGDPNAGFKGCVDE